MSKSSGFGISFSTLLWIGILVYWLLPGADDAIEDAATKIMNTIDSTEVVTLIVNGDTLIGEQEKTYHAKGDFIHVEKAIEILNSKQAA